MSYDLTRLFHGILFVKQMLKYTTKTLSIIKPNTKHSTISIRSRPKSAGVAWSRIHPESVRVGRRRPVQCVSGQAFYLC